VHPLNLQLAAGGHTVRLRALRPTVRSTSTPPLSSPARSAAPARWLLALTLGLGAVACGEEVRLEGPDAGCTSSNQCAEGEYCFIRSNVHCSQVRFGACVGMDVAACGCYFPPAVGINLPFPDDRPQSICGQPVPEDSGVRDLGTRD
jgi:hypothetical protein